MPERDKARRRFQNQFFFYYPIIVNRNYFLLWRGRADAGCEAVGLAITFFSISHYYIPNTHLVEDRAVMVPLKADRLLRFAEPEVVFRGTITYSIQDMRDFGI